jgi:hypothetical protein
VEKRQERKGVKEREREKKEEEEEEREGGEGPF